MRQLAKGAVPMGHDWQHIGHMIHEVLLMMYVKKPRRFGQIARKEGISKESLAAAAISGMLLELLGDEAERAGWEDFGDWICQRLHSMYVEDGRNSAVQARRRRMTI